VEELAWDVHARALLRDSSTGGTLFANFVKRITEARGTQEPSPDGNVDGLAHSEGAAEKPAKPTKPAKPAKPAKPSRPTKPAGPPVTLQWKAKVLTRLDYTCFFGIG